MTQPANDLAEIARELDVVASWHSGARGLKTRQLADRLWEQAGGRPEPQPGDANVATRGPGVRAQTVEVDSVGQIADAEPQTPANPPAPPAPPAAPTVPEHVAKTQRDKNS